MKDTFFQRLQFHILRNLEMTLSNVHLAYDDNKTKSYPFQFGITLEHFKLYVCLFTLLYFEIEFGFFREQMENGMKKIYSFIK